MMKKYFLGIDGGGTKTEAILCNEQGNILHRDRIAATNPNDVGIQMATDRLCTLIRGAHTYLENTCGEPVALHVFGGIAGALNHKEDLLAILRHAFPQDVIGINSDAVNLLSSELYLGDGCCLICGTGSVCMVRSGENLWRIAGWGYLLDQSGSGYSMGREALEAALRSHDGRGDATLLTGAVIEKLGGNPWDKLTEIYEGGKAFIASFAPCVTACAEEGDRIAFEILFRQSLYLAECLEAAYNRIGAWDVPLEVVLGGGLFQVKSDLIALIKQNATVPLHLTVASAPPVFGAVWEAVRNQTETVTEQEYIAFKNAFLSGY
ncbi:MAG: ROK family protein [Clostridia bacterium]|nr:ROK family protein [Clostridia bacterium]